MLTTDRLILRPFEPRDHDAFCAMNRDANVMRYFPSTRNDGETLAMLDTCAQRWENDGYAFSAVERINDGAFLGMCGLSRFDIDLPFCPCTEIGWRLIPSAWGQGYATEAATAWLDYGFTTLNLPEIVSFAPVPNIPSQKVMQRIGMTRDTTRDFGHPMIATDNTLHQMVFYAKSNHKS